MGSQFRLPPAKDLCDVLVQLLPAVVVGNEVPTLYLDDILALTAERKLEIIRALLSEQSWGLGYASR